MPPMRVVPHLNGPINQPTGRPRSLQPALQLSLHPRSSMGLQKKNQSRSEPRGGLPQSEGPSLSLPCRMVTKKRKG